MGSFYRFEKGQLKVLYGYMVDILFVNEFTDMFKTNVLYGLINLKLSFL